MLRRFGTFSMVTVGRFRHRAAVVAKSASPLLFSPTRNSSASPDDDDDDFVPEATIGATSANQHNNKSEGGDDVMSSAFLESMTSSSSSSPPSGSLVKSQDHNVTISSSSSSSSSLSILGVTRVTDLPEGTKLSRLNKPILPDSPTHDQYKHRQGSRAAALDQEPQLDEVTEVLAEETEHQRQQMLGSSGGGHQQQDDLPYEDANFAENILQMDVDGVIDETWQDCSQAKFEDAEAVVAVLKDARARDITVVDVKAKTSSFDYIVVATCDSQRHMTLAAWSVSEADRWQRTSKVRRRKADELWEIVPVGRILVNLMVESYRNEVAIERKWVVTKTMDPMAMGAQAMVSEGRQLRMHGLWTLTMNLQDLEDFEVDYCKDVLLSQL